jgi:acyl transferase domain-containing protein
VQRGARMNKIILLGVLLLSCCSPVKFLVKLSDTVSSSSAAGVAKYICQEAEIAAINGEREVVKRVDQEEIQRVIDELRRIDRRFKTEIRQDSIYTELIVRW